MAAYIPGDIESRRDDTALVDPAEELHNDLLAPVVIDNLEFTDVV